VDFLNWKFVGGIFYFTGPYKWPLIGNVVEVALADSKYPHIALAKLSKTYGDIMSLQFGSHPASNS